MSEYFVVIVLGLIALGAVAFPFLVGRERYASTADLDAEVRRYRDAVEADTVCNRCREANPAGSAFCGDCGAKLAPIS